MEGVFLFFSRGDALTADTAVEGHSSHLLTDMHRRVLEDIVHVRNLVDGGFR